MDVNKQISLPARLMWEKKIAAELFEPAVFDTLSSNIDLSTGTAAMTKSILSQL